MVEPNDTEASKSTRSHVTVLFADVCGYTRISELVDPEDVDSFKARIAEIAHAVIHKHGGSVSQIYGDGVLAVFGYPGAHENDTRRALEAALELHETVRQTSFADVVGSFDVRMHSGVHAGLVLARPGNELHGRYELIGDTVNTAARLAGAAQNDEVLISDAVQRSVEGFYVLEPVAKLELKGKSQALETFRVFGRSGARTRFEARERSGLTAFVGRSEELARLDLAYRAALRGSLRAVLINGLGGIGKTRLLREFRERVEADAAGMRALVGFCDSYGGIAPLEPFAQIVAQAFGLQHGMSGGDAIQVVESVLERWGGEALAHATSLLQLLSLTPLAERGERPNMAGVLEAISVVLAELAERSPLLLMLDDWQWADDASRKVLAQLLRDLSDKCVCIVVSQRPGEIDAALDESAATITLEPFTPAESQMLVEHVRSRDFEADWGQVAALHDRSGGHPLFLEELCRYMLVQSHAAATPRMPHSLQVAIQSRVATLPSQQVRVLWMAAVIGLEFSVDVLRALDEQTEWLPSLQALCACGLIYLTAAERTYRFHHGITREAVYESVLMKDRLALHRLIAATLERGAQTGTTLVDRSETLAYHYRNSADYERAAHFAERAGDKAMASYSLDRACFHYATALWDLDKLNADASLKQRWLRLSSKWALPLLYSPVWARGNVPLLERALEYAAELGDLSAQGQAGHWLAFLHYVLGDCPASISYYQRAIALAEAANDTRLAAQLWGGLGASHGAAGDNLRAIECLDKGLAMKRSQARGSLSHTLAQGFAYQLGCKAIAHADVGELAESARDMREALALISGFNHPIEGSVLGLECITLLWQGRYEDCVQIAAHARSIDERTTGSYGFAMASGFEAIARWRVERDPTALASVAKAIDWLETHGVRLYLSVLHSQLAEAAWVAGDHELAARCAEAALARASAGDRLGDASAYRVRARLLAAGGAAEAEVLAEVTRAYEAAERRSSERERALTQLLAAELWAAWNNPSLAREAALQARESLQRMDMAFYVAVADRLLA